MSDVSYIPITMGKGQKKLLLAVERFSDPVAVEMGIAPTQEVPGTMTLAEAQRQGFKSHDILKALKALLENELCLTGRIIAGDRLELEGPTVPADTRHVLANLPDDWFSSAKKHEERTRAKALLNGLHPDLKERTGEALRDNDPVAAVRLLIAGVSGVKCSLPASAIKAAIGGAQPHELIRDLIVEASLDSPQARRAAV